MQMVEVKDIYNLLPKIDCGMCGNPTCWTFARRVYTNLQEAHDCLPNRDKRNMDIEEIIKGVPKANPIIIQTIPGFIDFPKFFKNEEIIIMLDWFEDKTYGEYYLVNNNARGKFSIVETDSTLGPQVVNSALMGEKWKIPLRDFIMDIKDAQ